MSINKQKRCENGDVLSLSDSSYMQNGSRKDKDVWTSKFSPEVITVDQLKQFCRKKAVGIQLPKGNLHLLEGTFKNTVSEYTRCFKNFFKTKSPQSDSRKKNKRKADLEGIEYSQNHLLSDTNENKKESDRKSISSTTVQKELEVNKNRFGLKETKEITFNENYKTETSSKFVPFPPFANQQQRIIRRRDASNLKLEGIMENLTETKDKFVHHDVFINKFKDKIIPPKDNIKIGLSNDQYEYDDEKLIRYERFTDQLTIHPVIPNLRKNVTVVSANQNVTNNNNNNVVINNENNNRTFHIPNVPRVSVSSPGRKAIKEEEQIPWGGRFECQPEYRKAFNDYTLREKRFGNFNNDTKENKKNISKNTIDKTNKNKRFDKFVVVPNLACKNDENDFLPSLLKRHYEVKSSQKSKEDENKSFFLIKNHLLNVN